MKLLLGVTKSHGNSAASRTMLELIVSSRLTCKLKMKLDSTSDDVAAENSHASLPPGQSCKEHVNSQVTEWIQICKVILSPYGPNNNSLCQITDDRCRAQHIVRYPCEFSAATSSNVESSFIFNLQVSLDETVN